MALGAFLKNENKKEEIIEIVELLQQYVPTDEGLKQVHTVAFGGVQLTVERCRGSQSAIVTSDNQINTLEGVHSLVSPWHAEVVLLQVRHAYACMYMNIRILHGAVLIHVYVCILQFVGFL